MAGSVPWLRTVSDPTGWLADNVARTGLTAKEPALAVPAPLLKSISPQAARLRARFIIRK
jgi:hypothetical protein